MLEHGRKFYHGTDSIDNRISLELETSREKTNLNMEIKNVIAVRSLGFRIHPPAVLRVTDTYRYSRTALYSYRSRQFFIFRVGFSKCGSLGFRERPRVRTCARVAHAWRMRAYCAAGRRAGATRTFFAWAAGAAAVALHAGCSVAVAAAPAASATATAAAAGRGPWRPPRGTAATTAALHCVSTRVPRQNRILSCDLTYFLSVLRPLL